MSLKLPRTAKALTVQKASLSSASKGIKYDARLVDLPIPTLKSGELLVKIGAVAFNHQDLWIRLGQYPGIVEGSVFGADGAGVVVSSLNANDPLLHTRVFLTPMRGWKNHPEAPESRFGMVGGTAFPPMGTFSEYVVVEREEVIPSPAHLDDIHMSAWPLGGLTAWRAAIVNARVQPGHNVLITGIGGGVALLALQICVARGAHVYVSSGSDEKIKKAVELGARGGVNYNNKEWPLELAQRLQDSRASFLDSVIDSAGGDIMGQVGRLLKPAGRVVCYGMTAQPKITFTMREVLKHHTLIGSTMGSRQDLVDATQFMAEHKIVPVVSSVLDGLESAEEGFEKIRRGDHIGKIVIQISGGNVKPKL